MIVGIHTDTEDEEGNVKEQESTTTCTERVRKQKTQKPGKQGYIRCPVQGCLSGPIQKLTEHLQQVHTLPPHKVARLNTGRGTDTSEQEPTMAYVRAGTQIKFTPPRH